VDPGYIFYNSPGSGNFSNKGGSPKRAIPLLGWVTIPVRDLFRRPEVNLEAQQGVDLGYKGPVEKKELPTGGAHKKKKETARGKK